MNAAKQLLGVVVATVIGALIAEWLVNNVRPLRRLVGGL